MSYLGADIKKLGFGLMRLPVLGSITDIDITQVNKMTDMFIEGGFTYFDTAYGYHNGASETAVKEFLVDRYKRDKFQLATKLPAWAGPKTADEAKQMFFTSLKRTGAGYFDYYLLHNLGGSRTDTFDDFKIWDFLLEQKEKGLILNLGFSMHDTAQALNKVLEKHPEMDFVQLQINYADWKSPLIQSKRCYDVAMKHNKPVVIMEPIKGGSLANPPEHIAKILHDANPKATFASWALRFAASLPNVITVLSGMSNIEQMKDNISIMKNFTPLTDNERKTIDEVVKAYDAIPSIPCTYCGYCEKDCAAGIHIPKVMEAYNRRIIYNDDISARRSYSFLEYLGSAKPTACTRCGSCENTCPQGIKIMKYINEAEGSLG